MLHIADRLRPFCEQTDCAIDILYRIFIFQSSIFLFLAHGTEGDPRLNEFSLELPCMKTVEKTKIAVHFRCMIRFSEKKKREIVEPTI